MDVATIEEFAIMGFAWFRSSGIGLDAIAEWCNEEAAESGDQRYWILGAILLALDEWWASKDALGGISTNAYISLNETVMVYLRPTLREQDPTLAAQLAAQLALRIQTVMDGNLPPDLYTHDDDDY